MNVDDYMAQAESYDKDADTLTEFFNLDEDILMNMQFGLTGSSWKNSWQKKINHLRPSLSPISKPFRSTHSQALSGRDEIRW